MKQIDRRLLFQAAALVIGLAAAWPLFSEPGLLNTRGGGDSPFLLQRLQQMVVALEDGHFPARWMADANYGYGYPFFNYYAPLSIYAGALFRFLGYDTIPAIKLAQLAGFLLAAGGMFYLARRWIGSATAGLLASAAYTLAPFHMVNVYVRGDSLAEFWAMALYPWTLLAADEVVHRPGPRSALLLGLSYGVLVLCHNISALIFTPFLLLYLALALWGHEGKLESRRTGLLFAAAGLVLGLLLSAWFWLPALAESDLAQTAPITAGYFNYANHFLSRPVQASWLFSYEVAGREAFRMGLAQVLLALPGLVAAVYLLARFATGRSPITPFTPHAGGVRPAPLLFVVIALLVATLMLTALSAPLWDLLPLLPFTQFPWRFLSVQAAATALLTGFLAWLPFRRIITAAALLILLVAGLGGLRTDFLPLAEADVSAAELAGYEWFTGNIGSTVSAEYLPQTVAPRPFTSNWLETGVRTEARFLSGSGVAMLSESKTQRQTWQLTVDSAPTDLILPTLYWPGWRAEMAGVEIALEPAPGSGLILLPDLPAGEHTVVLTLGQTPVRLAAELTSLLALVAIVVIVALLTRPVWRKALQAGAVILVLLSLLWVGGRLWPKATYAAGTRSWDFAQMAYLHHAPEGIAYESGARLLHYAYDGDAVRPGESLEITLTWELPDDSIDESLTIALATPAIHRFPYAPFLAMTTAPRAVGEQTVRLEVPDNAPAGQYIPRLTLSDAAALTSSDQPRGELFLEPVRVLADGQPGDFASALELVVGDVSVSGEPPTRLPAGIEPPLTTPCQASDSRLTLKLAWYTATPLSENYNVSLRLADAGARDLMLCDGQPGHGYRPSSQWPAGQLMDDWLGMPLPESLPASDPYILTARLYEVGSGRPVLTRRLGQLVWQGDELVFEPLQPTFAVPDGIDVVEASFGEGILLRGFRRDAQEDRLTVELFWQALAQMPADYLRFAHLVDPETGEIVAQWDGTPANESYPTSQWTAGEIVADSVSLDMAGVPPGDYQLFVGFYQDAPGFPRLRALDSNGLPVPDDRFLLTDALTWP